MFTLSDYLSYSSNFLEPPITLRTTLREAAEWSNTQTAGAN